jgi:hypothetical protein
MCFRFLQVMVASSAPANCRTTTMATSMAGGGVPPVDVDVLSHGRQPAHARPEAHHGRRQPRKKDIQARIAARDLGETEMNAAIIF